VQTSANNSVGVWRYCVSPILGIYASQITGHLSTNSYESIATVTGSGSSVTFSSIPSTYKNLQIRYMDLSGVLPTILDLQFNSDTAANYSSTQPYGDGSSAAAGGAANTTYIGVGVSGSSTYPSAGVVDILDYQNTNKYKTVRTLNGVDVNGAGGYAWFSSGSWRNTNAVASITLFINRYSFNQYSSFALYGVK
jgi:hypothetical protein